MRSFLILFVYCFPLILYAQLPSGYRHFSTDDGLPSSEVYEILQDRQGYLWFGTDNGLSRFNGYTFQNFGAIDGLTDPVLFNLREDRHGRVWMQGMSGKLFYYEDNKINAFSGNAQLDTFNDRPIISKGFYIDSSDYIYCSLLNIGLIRFSPEGELTPLINDLYSLSVFKIEEEVFSVFCFDNTQMDKTLKVEGEWVDRNQLPLTIIEGKSNIRHIVPKGSLFNSFTSFSLKDKGILVQLQEYIFGFKGEKMLFYKKQDKVVNCWYQLKNGNILTGLSNRGGIRFYNTISDIPANRFTTLLDGYTISHILEDREGGFWFATTEAGVFYQPNPRMIIFNRGSGMPVDQVTSVAIKNKQECFAGFDGAGIFHIDLLKGAVTSLPPAGGRIFDLAYDRRDDVLWAATADVQYLQEGKWNKMMDMTQSESQKRPIPLYSKHFHFSPDRRDIWSANHFGFFKIHSATRSIGLYSLDVKINNAVYASRTLDVLTSFSGRTWIANMNGLYELKDHELLPVPPLHPAFGVRVEALAELPDSTLVIGSKGYGLVFWKGDQIASLSEQDGLTSNMIANLLADKEGRLWAGTFNGLNRIVWKWGKSADLRTITKAQGLPDNGIADIEVLGNNIWVATDAGLAFFTDGAPVSTLAPPPIIEKIWVNDRVCPPDKLLYLSPRENNLAIHFASLQYRNAGSILYRYRLQEKDEWRYTQEHQLNFAALASGSYCFEVQAQNAEKQWSDAVLLPFVIHAPWWLTWWFLSGLVITLLGLIFAFYRYREQELRKKLAIEQQLSDLERKALQAQMNPHFIFNCLNSLQLLIMQNDSDKALHYLGIFANLVRGILNASILGMLSVEEEIKMLTHYLTMEKLRFKERFDFEIKTAPGLNTMNRALPPMLIQPYVENAVLHGMKRKIIGGLVTIEFEQEADQLIVTISDNGMGIGASGPPPTDYEIDINKSVGMLLTRKRLELLNGATDEGLVQVVTLKNESGEIAGTRVRVMIRTVQIIGHSKGN